MTTFVLHGGATSNDSQSNNEFFRQFTSLVNKNIVSIILCYWARDKKEWSKLYEEDKRKITNQTRKKVVFALVNDSNEFFDILKTADVVYFRGGYSKYIDPYIPKLSNLKKHLKDKVYIGSSMGAYIVSKQYLAILPFNIICHWNTEKDKDKKLKVLKQNDPNTTVLLLEEEKFCTFTI